MVGILIAFWEVLFSGAMLVYQGVTITPISPRFRRLRTAGDEGHFMRCIPRLDGPLSPFVLILTLVTWDGKDVNMSLDVIAWKVLQDHETSFDQVLAVNLF